MMMKLGLNVQISSPQKNVLATIIPTKWAEKYLVL